MLVVTVDFTVKPQFVAEFRAEMVRNARASRETEPGCRRFDVAWSDRDPTLVFLYELYDDMAAFEAHTRTGHFKAFDAKTAPWVAAKSARLFQLADTGS